jgi:16S rRNA (uracil1498-N3)-methyltransferase
MARFLVPGVKAGAEIELPEAEARHAVRSLRLGPGDRVTLLDGAGSAFEAEIVRVKGRSVVARAVAASAAARSTAVRVCSALPKGKRLAWMIQKLSELGVAEFVPVAFARSVVRWSASKAAKLERVAAEAAKQSGRADVLRFLDETTPAELSDPAIFVADPSAERTLLRSLEGQGPATVVIGPEGGIEPAELESLGGIRVCLGPTILRVETAAVAAAAVLAQR